MYPIPLQNLIELLAKLPGVGPRQAARYALFILKETPEYRNLLANSIETVAGELLNCRRCGNIEAKKASEENLCSICRNPKRNQNRVAIVDDIMDLRALEHTHAFDGLYHVLGGSVVTKKNGEAALERLKRCVERMTEESPEEIIIGTSPTFEGESTAAYLVRELAKTGSRITRLARGLSKGVDLEYVDEDTLREALEGRR
jgi:recombination protein RecR